MAVETETSRVAYTGAGTTGPFSIPFYFLANGDIRAIKVTIADGTEDELELTTDFTLTGAGDENGGALTLVSSISSSYRLVIFRDPELLQEADYPANDAFPSETHEQALDRAMMISQRNRDLLDRSLRQPDGDAADIDVLPAKVTRASKFLAFDGDGDPTASEAPVAGTGTPVTAFAATMLDDASAAAARTTLGVGDIVPVSSASGTNTITGTIPAANIAYVTGGIYVLIPAATNTGATTINLTPSGASALGAKNVFSGGAACVGGEVVIGVPVILSYDGTQMNIIGALTKSGDIDLSTGALRGLKFDGTQNASADANTLDDYEEGTWTPAVGGTATYTAQTGHYTKIGRVVHVQGRLVINSIGTGSTGVISGLPFTAANFLQAISIGYFALSATNYTWVGGFVSGGATTITLTATAAAVAGATNPAVFFGNGSDIVFAGSYIV